MEIIALVISGVSLLLAGASFYFSMKSQSLQNKVNEIEYKLKKYELDAKEQQACIEARIIHDHKNKYKIKIWNSGNFLAKNISVSWNGEDGILCFDSDKLPFEVLEPQKNFDLKISTYGGSPSKIQIKTEWEDESGNKHDKTQWCDF